MKKVVVFLIITFLITPKNSLGTEVTSQTFLFPRPIYNNLPPQFGPWLIFTGTELDSCGASFQIVGATQDGHNTSSHTGYFGIDCKENLLFAGDDSPLANIRDVRAEYFNLPSNFSGVAQIDSEQKQRGFWITYQQKLNALFDIEWFYHWTLAVRVPVIWVRNTLNFEELSTTNPGTDPLKPRNIIEALNQRGLNFAKIYTGRREDQGIPEVRFDLRTTFIETYPFYLAAYTGIIIPTFPKINAEYLFEPVVGINRHPGIIAGANFQFPLSGEDCPWLFCFYFDAENRFYIRTTQCRTFDLRNLDKCHRKQWSRYLPVRREGEEETTFAANVLTLPVKVKPDNRANLDWGIRYYYGNFEAEAGFQIWVHGDERIVLKDPECELVPLEFESFGIAGTGTSSASQSTINELAPNDPEFITIKINDLDLLSGAARGATTFMAHFSLAYTTIDEYTVTPFMMALGAFYEAPKNNAAFTNWGLWGKVGTRF